MSGIKNLKEKSKIQLDEMFENKPTENPRSQKDEKKTIQQTTHLTNQPASNPTNQQSINPEIQLNEHPAIRTPRYLPNKSIKLQQNQKTATYKMTFNLSEDIYKAFNDLYANRMLEGRKTEKSEMICEAILWLIKKEEEQLS